MPEITDLVKYSTEVNDFIIQHIREYCSNRTTTRLLINGVVVITASYILKSWLNALRERRKSGLRGAVPLPIFGNFLSYAINGLNANTINIVNKYGKNSIFFEGTKPVILTADAELIKAITIRDFKHFTARNTYGLDNIKPLDAMLIILQGEDWKNLRAIITSGFTGNKMKNMTGCIKKTCDSFSSHLDGLIAKNEYLDVKKMYTNFTVDIVCSTFFGVDVDTISDNNHPLPKCIAQLMNDLAFSNGLKFIFTFVFPSAAKYLMEKKWMSFFDEESMKYVSSLSNQIIEDRRSKKTVRNDFIQMMVDHEETEDTEQNKTEKTHLKKTLTNAEILSQSILFMLVGSDTTASTLTWITHNLVMYPECQDKLIKEVDSVLEQHNGEINYDTVNDMPYMNSVISETQRMYTVTYSDRVATEDYEYKLSSYPHPPPY